MEDSFRRSKREIIRAMFYVTKTVFAIAPWSAVSHIVGAVFTSVLPLVTAYFAAQTTTALVGAFGGDEAAQQQAITLTIITSLIGVVALLWSKLRYYIETKSSFVIRATVEDGLIERFVTLPFSAYDDQAMGDLYEKASRFGYVFSRMFSYLSTLASSIVGVVLATVALFVVIPWIGLAVLVTSVPVAYIRLKLARNQFNHWTQNIVLRRKQFTLERLLFKPSAISEMRIYGAIDNLRKTYSEWRRKDEYTRIQYDLSSERKELIFEVGQRIVEVAALLWVVIEIINRNQPVGQFVYVQQLVQRAFGEVESFAFQLGTLDDDMGNVVDYEQFMNLEQQVFDRTPLVERPRTIQAQSVSFEYPGTNIRVLDDVTLTIEPGKHVAIVGENGAGKSTFIKILMGLYEPTGGVVMVDDRPLSGVELASWHKYIALLQQEFIKYDFANIKDNIVFGDMDRAFDDTEYERSKKQAEVDNFIEKLEKKDQTYINRWLVEDSKTMRATDLSGGQSQRLALARNFYRDAPIVVLDEPTSAIDAAAETRIFKRLFESDKTIIVVSHRLSTIRKADIVYMLDNGKLVETGTTDELLAKKGAFYELFKGQI